MPAFCVSPFNSMMLRHIPATLLVVYKYYEDFTVDVGILLKIPAVSSDIREELVGVGGADIFAKDPEYIKNSVFSVLDWTFNIKPQVVFDGHNFKKFKLLLNLGDRVEPIGVGEVDGSFLYAKVFKKVRVDPKFSTVHL